MKLKELRGKLTQTEIANKLNLSQKTYSNYENGNSEPNIATLILIADYYGVSLDYLCEHKTHNQDLGYLTELQLQLVKILKELNEQNTIQALGYLSGLLASQ